MTDMATYSKIKDFLVTTDTNTSKNLSSGIVSFAQSSITVASGTYTSRTYTIPLTESTRLYQIYLNLSVDGDLWTALPCRDRSYGGGGGTTIPVNVSQSGNELVLNLFFVNSSASSYTFSAMTVNVAVRVFVDELG